MKSLTTCQTSAHTLAFAFILLALYPDEQEKFYQNIKQLLGDGRTPVRPALGLFSSLLLSRLAHVGLQGYEEFSTFAYTMA